MLDGCNHEKESTPKIDNNEVHFVQLGQHRPAVDFHGMLVLGLGERDMHEDFPELFTPSEDLSAANPDDQPQLGV